jgi:hypothetical protein
MTGPFTRRRLSNKIDALTLAITYQIPFTTGDVYYVDSVTGSDSNSGESQTEAVATLDYAIGLCTASQGDIIILMPGHAETLVAAGGVAMDVIGVTVIALGEGRKRATFTFTTDAAASFNISAANCKVKNCVFINGIDSQTAMINVSAADVTIEGCEIVLADASTQATLGILTTAAADRFRVEGCHIHGSADAGCATAIRVVGGSDAVFKKNNIQGAFTTTLGGIQNVTTECVRVLVDDNVIINTTASSAVCCTFVATNATGAVRNNTFGILTGTAPIVGTGLTAISNNYYKAAAGAAAGTLV